MATPPSPKLENSEAEAGPQQHPRFSKVTPEYRKAHKNYVLAAALLASWELIGINLNTKEKWGIELTSPKGIPLILYTLLIYCAYKVIIEWKQSDDGKPKSKVALFDYYVAHAIGVSAILIGAIQALLKIRIADLATSTTYGYIKPGSFVSGVLLAELAPPRIKSHPVRLLLMFACYFGFLGFAGFWLGRWPGMLSTTLPSIFGLMFGVVARLVWILLSRILTLRVGNHKQPPPAQH